MACDKFHKPSQNFYNFATIKILNEGLDDNSVAALQLTSSSTCHFQLIVLRHLFIFTRILTIKELIFLTIHTHNFNYFLIIFNRSYI